MKLSEKILYCRRKAMMSQEALAERVGVSRQSVSKWETGEASPEIGKLLLLAQTFGVTTDWLLSEDEPAPENRPEPEAVQSEPVYQPQPVPPESVHTWVDDIPGMLGTLIRKYGWIFGVRLAVGGAAMLAFGILVSLVSSTFFNGADSIGFGLSGADFFDSSAPIQFYDENGSAIANPSAYYGMPMDDLYDLFDIQQTGSTSSFNSFSRTGRGIFGLFSGFVTLVGAVLLIAGIILAIQLKKLDRS